MKEYDKFVGKKVCLFLFLYEESEPCVRGSGVLRLLETSLEHGRTVVTVQHDEVGVRRMRCYKATKTKKRILRYFLGYFK